MRRGEWSFAPGGAFEVYDEFSQRSIAGLFSGVPAGLLGRIAVEPDGFNPCRMMIEGESVWACPLHRLDGGGDVVQTFACFATGRDDFDVGLQGMDVAG